MHLSYFYKWIIKVKLFVNR